MSDPVPSSATNSFTEFFQEDNGGMSMARFILFFIVVVPFVVWVAIAIHNWALPDMPGGILSIQGGAMAAKYLQKSKEQGLPDPPAQ